MDPIYYTTLIWDLLWEGGVRGDSIGSRNVKTSKVYSEPVAGLIPPPEVCCTRLCAL